MESIEIPQEKLMASKKWASDVHKDMTAATILDLNLLTYKSVCTDLPEEVLKYQLMEEMIKEYKPKECKELKRFLPNIV